ncbi:hypothetical protein [Xanthocytophaga flava]|uniref:hypothetical protein n=1 Tax=Xanthocytophaga flava TaxID=3048013 RepID=UPI0028D6A6BB|nr:hypothetical protein [Xanthocytophaga flavus]MDJ1469632.1 hypothetical protein [Xanthocytophaga flavus]
MVYLICKNCTRKISDFLVNQVDDLNALNDDNYFEDEENVYISLKNGKQAYMGYHKNRSISFDGCCGCREEGPLNRICAGCEVALGREVSDCESVYHYIRIVKTSIDVIEVTTQYEDKLYTMEKSLKFNAARMEEWLVLLKWKPKEFAKRVKKI